LNDRLTLQAGPERLPQLQSKAGRCRPGGGRAIGQVTHPGSVFFEKYSIPGLSKKFIYLNYRTVKMNITLSKDEKLIREDLFTTNLVLFWLKTNFSLTTKRIMGYAPNTILGIIPLGKAEITYPLKNIAGVSSSTKFHFKRFIFGVILILIGIAMVQDPSILSVVILLFGAILLLNSYTSTFTITNNAGEAPVIELSILEKNKVKNFVAQINHQIADL